MDPVLDVVPVLLTAVVVIAVCWMTWRLTDPRQRP
jgi:hypothetical protein